MRRNFAGLAGLVLAVPLAACSSKEVEACMRFLDSVQDAGAIYSRIATSEDVSAPEPMRLVHLQFQVRDGIGNRADTLTCKFRLKDGKPDTRGFEQPAARSPLPAGLHYPRECCLVDAEPDEPSGPK